MTATYYPQQVRISETTCRLVVRQPEFGLASSSSAFISPHWSNRTHPAHCIDLFAGMSASAGPRKDRRFIKGAGLPNVATVSTYMVSVDQDVPAHGTLAGKSQSPTKPRPSTTNLSAVNPHGPRLAFVLPCLPQQAGTTTACLARQHFVAGPLCSPLGGAPCGLIRVCKTTIADYRLLTLENAQRQLCRFSYQSTENQMHFPLF
jgi:hypothetical protein